MTNHIDSTILYHQNYMHYLMLAWTNHFSVILSPDIVFYTILCELSDFIKRNTETFNYLFTSTNSNNNNNKYVNLQLNTATPQYSHIDLNQIIARL